jgi:hypothetical protein
MLSYPKETWDQYKARYRDAYADMRSQVMMGTSALSGGGADISRDEPDYFLVDLTVDQMDHFWVGSWVTGFGFFNVKFPKGTSRPVTDEEWEWFLDNPVTM